MDLMRAFMVMLGGVTAADAPRRQVNGILVWRDYVYEAVKRAAAVPGGDRAGTEVDLVTPSGTHLEWRMAAGAILDALAEQANAADVAYAKALAAEAAAMRAAEEAAAEAVACMAAAAAADDAGEAAGYLAEAEMWRARAAEWREEARRQAAIAAAAMAWGIAARDAIAFGVFLVAQENDVAFPVGEALAAAGGPSEVYGEKHALTLDGGAARPLAIRGGAR